MDRYRRGVDILALRKEFKPIMPLVRKNGKVEPQKQNILMVCGYQLISRRMVCGYQLSIQVLAGYQLSAIKTGV